MSDSLQPRAYPSKNSRVASHSLLQAIFLTQGRKLGLPHCRPILYHPKLKKKKKKTHTHTKNKYVFSHIPANIIGK